MKTFKKAIALAGACAAALAISPVADAAKGGNGNGNGGVGDVVSSIAINAVARVASPYQLGDAITYTTTIEPLRGPEWPMVYTECRNLAGVVVYGQLDAPGAVFVLGGGASPWLTTGGDAICEATLRAYGGKDRGVDTIRILASTGAFYVVG